jgi:hypothetical protein
MKMQCKHCGTTFTASDIEHAQKLFKTKVVQKAYIQFIHLLRGECYGL